ncbi:MAG: thioredoxin [Flavobacteriales bacterium]
MKNLLSSLLMMLVFSCTQHSQNTQAVQLLPANEFEGALKSTSSASIIDVRTPEEFRGGHLNEAVNFNIYDADFDTRIGKIDRNSPVFVYCKAGGRSAEAAERMKNMGFSSIYDLEGGYMAWKAAGMETTASETIAIEKFTLADFEKLVQSQTPVLIDYYAPWCGPCKKMEPILSKLASEYEGRVQIVRINVDEAANVVTQQKIENIPVVSTFKSGSEIKRAIGFQDEAALRAMIEELLR